MFITWHFEILDFDWPVAAFQGLIFPDNNRSKLITHGKPDAANNFDRHNITRKLNINMSFNKTHDIIFPND